MDQITNQRKIDPFYDNAVNEIFKHPEKTAFVMDGPIGVGKTSDFLFRGAYVVAQHVSPITKKGKQIRESKWAIVRESENSAIDTAWQILEGALFTPEILALDNSPVKQYGSHPTTIEISHSLPDGTFLEMRMQCHGFNNEKAASRLRSQEFLGGMIPEMQSVPYHVFETLVERCGRWRTKDITIERVIDGKKYMLSGVTGLATVLCDVNIPPRDHELYTQYYDVGDKDELPTMFLTPPPPLIPVPEDKANDDIKAAYPMTKFEGQNVVWVPNPKIYNMTRHYEELDENKVPIPWSGYKYWFKRLHSNDSHIRRYVLGKPDTIGGQAAVYNTFEKNDITVCRKEIGASDQIYIGFDPGGHSALELLALKPNNSIHFFKEFYVTPEDRTSTKKLFMDFLFPWCAKNLQGKHITIVPDPASTSLGKNVSMGYTESHLTIMRECIAANNKDQPMVTFSIEQCKVYNQDTETRVNSLGYYVDQQTMSIDPKECPMFLGGMAGGYQRKKLSSGLISDKIDKDNPYSHPVEAGQYPVVNILQKFKKGLRNAQSTSRSGITKAKRVRR